MHCAWMWRLPVAGLQQELVSAHEVQVDKLIDFQRHAENTATAQQAAFDKKVSDVTLCENGL